MGDPIQMVEAKVKTWFERTWFWRAITSAWKWLLNFSQFLDDPKGKFSSTRLALLSFAAVGILELFRKNDLEAAGCGIAVVVLAFIIAVFRK